MNNMPLNRMMYCSNQQGYSAQISDGVISQELDGGAPRYRKAIKGSMHTVNITWVVQEYGYQYLMAFYRVWARKPSQPFLARLCIDSSEFADYQCFYEGSPSLAEKKGKFFTVTATLRVKPLNISADLDDLLVEAGNDQTDLTDLFNPLEKLVNDDLPNALENIHD